MKQTTAVVFAVLAVMAAGTAARAHDPWDIAFVGDDSGLTVNTLSPGLAQLHDLDQGALAADDQDWAVVPTLEHHSYEARVSGSMVGFDWGICPTCAQFERVDGDGLVLTEDVATVQDGAGGGPEAYDRSVRWIAWGDTIQDFVRVRGAASQSENAGSVYTLRYWDTTYTLPRWNAAGGQVTVVVLTSLVPAAVTGSIHFFSGTGALVHTQPFALARDTPFVFNTGSVPALAGLSGYALVPHTAGYGGLSGKAVALDPATGFTFDTALQPIPQ